MIKIAICDDIPQERELLKRRLDRFAKEYALAFSVDMYSAGEKLLEKFAGQYDIVLLDVVMDGMDGIQTAKKIREKDVLVKIIFSTQHKQYAYDSFSVDPEGYFLKSESYAVFENILKRTLRRIRTCTRRIELNYQGETVFLELNQILYAQYSDGAVVIRLIDGGIAKTKGALKDFMERDVDHVLLLIDRNMAINLMWMEGCQDGYVTFKTSKKRFKISRRRRREVENRFFAWCRERINDD